MSTLSNYTPSLYGDDIAEKRREINDYFQNTFTLFESCFDMFVSDDIFYTQSEKTRHPMIFYYGHTATFFINKLINMKIIDKRINPEYESIFAVGVDEMTWDDMEKSHYQWPSVEDTKAYRKRVRRVVSRLINELDFSLPITQESPLWIILMGIEHERIHIETSLVLHRQLPIDAVKQIDNFAPCKSTSLTPKNEMLGVNAAEITLGKTLKHHLYGWDNEYGTYKESLSAFKASKYLVSNGEFMEFVLEGGYENIDFWDDEGREFLQKSGAKQPAFWILKEGVYTYRTLTQEISMPFSWPVDVNALEAEAFCRYKSKKEGVIYQLPSEAEYAALYKHSKLEDIPAFHESRANLNFYHYASSCPVDEFCFNGFYDVVGNVWQWSRTPIRPFDGFKVHEAYDDFSVPTFDEKHALILGSSWASSGNLITQHSRYAFRKHFYQNAGFRYVVSEKNEEKDLDIYESDALVSQYCEFQYGETHFGVENFAVATAKIASSYTPNKTKALDLGCATGRSSYELAKTFDSVEGIDFSVRFVQVGAKLKSEGYLAFSVKQEGEIYHNNKVTIEELGYENLREKVSFWQGDACNLKPNFNSYDLIMATNLIDRLYKPMVFLDSISQRLNAGGILVLTSPYTWQESSTAKEFWLGGYYDENENEIKTIDTLQRVLKETFELVHREDVEFVIKETARKYQHTISELSVWRKK